MRLINTSTIELEDFMDSMRAPSYAILSHTWGDDEVTFQDFINPDVAKERKGYRKIELTCQQAKERGIDYAWVDTCCIDKTSSAELSEAINSMFQWYAISQVCYVWLTDLGAAEPIESFSKSRWFTRGWTLQELIAPKVVEFYDEGWVFRGTKADLSEELQKATGIDGEVLRSGTIGVLGTIPLARRMSWASHRVTTRLEDMAYCLLGIFDVNMPMLYGEGEKAFIRLQEEITKESNDLSLFAWVTPSESSQSAQKYHGILALSPAYFRNAGDIIAGSDSRFAANFATTNKGLAFQVAMVSEGSSSLMPLNCCQGDTSRKVAIYLKQHGAGLYARARADTLALSREWIPSRMENWRNRTELLGKDGTSNVFVSKRVSPELSTAMDRNHHHAIRLGESIFAGPWKPMDMRPPELYDPHRKLFLTHGLTSFVGFVELMLDKPVRDKILGASVLQVIFGIQDSEPWITLGTHKTIPDLNALQVNLKKLGEVARQSMTRQMVLQSVSKGKGYENEMTITAALEETMLDGEPVYFAEVRAGEIRDLTNSPGPAKTLATDSFRRELPRGL